MEFLTYDYNWILVFFSVLVAIFTAVVALDLITLLPLASATRERWILITCSLVLGIGIWSMHFIRMLAIKFPIEVTYDVPLVLLSMFPALIASAVTLYLIGLPSKTNWQLPVGALVFTLGVLIMYGIEMEALQMAARIHYDLWRITLAAVVGYMVSYLVLSLLLNAEWIAKTSWRKFTSAFFMGIAFVFIHYIGMAAVLFIPTANSTSSLEEGIDSTYLGYGISIAAFYFLSLTYKIVYMDRKLLVQSQESELKFQALIESAHDAIIVTKTDGTVVQWNNGAERLFGYTKEDISGNTIFTVVPKHIHASHQLAVAEFLNLQDPSSFERMIETKGLTRAQEEFPIEVSIGTWMIAEERFISYIVRDITDRKQEEAQMKDLIYLDDLTGLPNRRLFSERLQSMLVRANERDMQFAVLYLDLDNFKKVNDQYGHHVGDELLNEVSVRIYKNLGRFDTLARIGGDEFLFLLTETDKHQITQFAEWLISCFKKPFDIDGVKHSISPAIGISMYPIDGIDAETLVRNADAALYWVKESGKNGFQFYSHGEELDTSTFEGRRVLRE